MSKTKTIPLEIPAEWEFERAVAGFVSANGDPPEYSCRVVLHSTHSWHWNESPTDEMALLRPDCEVKFADGHCFHRRKLVAVFGNNHVAIDDGGCCAGWQYCRVRIDDATGKVIVRWDS